MPVAHITGSGGDSYDWADENGNTILGYKQGVAPVWTQNGWMSEWDPGNFYQASVPTPAGMTKDQAWGSIDLNNIQGSNLSTLLNFYRDPANFQKYGAGRADWMTSPDGLASLSPEAGNIIDVRGHGPGEDRYSFNDDGTFNKTRTGSDIIGQLQGTLMVLGAAAGFGAIGAGAAGGAAAGAGEAGAAGASSTGGSFGVGGLGTGSATGASYGLGTTLGGTAAGSTYGGAAIGGGLGGAAGAAVGAAAGAGEGSFGAGGLGTGSTTGGSYGLGTTLGGEVAPYTFGGQSLYTSPFGWDAAAGALGTAGTTAATTSATTTPAASTTAGTTTTAASALQNVLNGTATTADWLKLGLGATSLIGGAAAGSQGQESSTTATKSLDPRMDTLLYNGLAPMTMGTLGATMPAAKTAGEQMLSVGSGLLGQTAPTTATNPYLSGIADDMSRRTQDLLGQNNLAIQGRSVATGGLGGSRQGVAQGIEAGKAADYLQGNVANLYGTAYAGDQNRLLQQQTLGAGLLSQGIDTQFQPLKNATSVFSPFVNNSGSVSGTTQTGGGTSGLLGGALTGAAFGRQMGWW